MLLLGFEVPLWSLLTVTLAILCYWSYDGRTANLFVADAEMAKQIGIKDFDIFTNRRRFFVPSKLLSRSINLIEDDHWKHLRGSISPTFTSGKLKQMVRTIDNCADRLVERMGSTNSKPFNIKDYTSGYTMDVIASTAFGIEIDSQKEKDHPFIRHASVFFGTAIPKNFWDKITSGLRLLTIFIMPPQIISILDKYGLAFTPRESQEYFLSMVDKVLETRMDESVQQQTDFLQMCISKMISLDNVPKDSLKTTSGNLWSTQGMTRDEIISNATIFIIAGYETTATTLHWFFYEMAKHPKIQQRLYEHIVEHCKGDSATYEELTDMGYLEQCLNETMRLFPGAPRIDRRAARDTEVGGYKIRKDQIITLSVLGIHYNPEYWPEPEVYNPDRFAPENKEDIQQYTFLPFGIGNRSCIAMRLALLEAKLGIVKIMRKFRFERTDAFPERIEYRKGSGFPLPTSPIELKAIPRS